MNHTSIVNHLTHTQLEHSPPLICTYIPAFKDLSNSANKPLPPDPPPGRFTLLDRIETALIKLTLPRLRHFSVLTRRRLKSSPPRVVKVCNIFLSEVSHAISSAKDPERFVCALIDSGASSSVIGKSQVQALCKLLSIPLILSNAQGNFKFVHGQQNSIGSIHFDFPTNIGTTITIPTHVVFVHLPFRLGLDFCTAYLLVLDLYSDTLRANYEGCTQHLARCSGHLYWT